MLRLSTIGYDRFQQSSKFESSFAGAETNVAVDLAIWGEKTRFLTVLPNNPLGFKCLSDVMQYNVDTNFVKSVTGRLGVMFIEKGASQRGSQVIYDRRNSCISETKLDTDYFKNAFHGCDWFHFTGITPAISKISWENCVRAIEVAKQLGMTISTDLNYRAKLWNYGTKATEIMPSLIRHSNIIIGNEEDAILSLGLNGKNIDVTTGILPIDNYQIISEDIFKQNPQCKYIAFTLRESLSANHNKWSAVLFCRDSIYISKKYDITHIVDRVGAGDSFAAGLIFGLRFYREPQLALEYAIAASCIKHTVSGDYCLATVEEIETLMNGNNSGRIKR